MTPVTLHGREVHSVFELLGSSENSITYSLGWAFSKCSGLVELVAERIGAAGEAFDQIRLQEHGEDGGYTDIELLGPAHHAIIEAKRGWWLPSGHQFGRYAPRFEKEARPWRRFVAMSDCTTEYAKLHLPSTEAGIDLAYLGWRDVEGLCRSAKGSHAEKRLLDELRTYLRKVATMQDIRSNSVYVVSLGSGNPDGATISWIDIIAQLGLYFHPVGKTFPKEPPNYVGFRYWGQLQSIHHIESYVVTTCLADHVPGMPAYESEPYFVYKLGPAIRPAHIVKAGPRVIRNARVWAALDLLLTCETVTDAWQLTKAREEASGL